MSKRKSSAGEGSRKRQKKSHWDSLPLEIVDKIIYAWLSRVSRTVPEWDQILSLRRVCKTFDERIVDCLYGHRNLCKQMPPNTEGVHYRGLERVKLQKQLFSTSRAGSPLGKVVNSTISALKGYNDCSEHDVRNAILDILLCWNKPSKLNTLLKCDGHKHKELQPALDSSALLCVAAFLGRIDIMEAVRAKGVFSADKDCEYLGNALIAASRGGNLEAVKWLIAAGADSFTKKKGGHSGPPLHVASHWGHDDVVRYLFKHCPEPLKPRGLYGFTMTAAATGGRSDTVQLLHSLGARATPDWFACDHEGSNYRCPLYAAMLNGHEKVAIQLLENGALLPKGYYSVLEIASRRRQFELVRYIMDNKAVQAIEMRKSLAEAASTNHLPIVEYFYEKGVRLNSPDVMPAPLQSAIAKGCDETARYLIEKGASVHDAQKRHQYYQYAYTPLAIASIYKRSELAQLLLQKGVHPDGRFYDKDWDPKVHPLTPLAISTFMGDLETMRVLLEAGANVDSGFNRPDSQYPNLREDYHYSPGAIAAAMGSKSVQELLWEHSGPLYDKDPSMRSTYIEDSLFPTQIYRAHAAGRRLPSL